MKVKKLTDKQKLEIAIHALKIYGNMDFWQYRGFCNKFKKIVNRSKLDPKYTSLEVRGRDGLVKDGWEWAEEALREMEGKEKEFKDMSLGEVCKFEEKHPPFTGNAGKSRKELDFEKNPMWEEKNC